MSGPNQPSLSQTSSLPQVRGTFQQNDDIDLRELFKALWAGKWIIILAVVCCAAVASGLCCTNRLN